MRALMMLNIAVVPPMARVSTNTATTVKSRRLSHHAETEFEVLDNTVHKVRGG